MTCVRDVAGIARGDGKRYKLILRTEASTEAPIYQCDFVAGPDWQTHRFEPGDFRATFRGRAVEAPALAFADVKQFGILTSPMRPRRSRSTPSRSKKSVHGRMPAPCPSSSIAASVDATTGTRGRKGSMIRRLFALALIAALALPAAAQSWPDKPVRIVTPFGPGGGTDVFARLLAQRLSEVYGKQFLVENRPGAGSTLGTEFVAKSAPDGATLLMTSASFAFNPGLYGKLRYDPIKDFAQVSLVARVPLVILVHPAFPGKNLQDLLRMARAKPGEVMYASSGPGSAMHLAGALFATLTDTNLGHVPYKGGTGAATAVMSGEVTASFSTIETVLQLLRAGRLRPLAVSTRERAIALPDVPTAMESGVKDYEVVGWFGLMAPAGTPRPVIESLSREVARAMAGSTIRERTLEEGATPVGSTPEEAERFVRDEIAKWTPVIRAAGIKLD
jgi:tripartite-type tricarboxylate transporter receptor subunit TctC